MGKQMPAFILIYFIYTLIEYIYENKQRNPQRLFKFFQIQGAAGIAFQLPYSPFRPDPSFYLRRNGAIQSQFFGN